MYARHNSIMIYHNDSHTMHCRLHSVQRSFWMLVLKRWFGGNISAPKVGCVNQALHGFREFELFKTRSNNYLNLWKMNKFALLQHVCNKCLQHLATTSTRLVFITLTVCISSDATNVCFTLHHNSLANAEVWRCIF